MMRLQLLQNKGIDGCIDPSIVQYWRSHLSHWQKCPMLSQNSVFILCIGAFGVLCCSAIRRFIYRGGRLSIGTLEFRDTR